MQEMLIDEGSGIVPLVFPVIILTFEHICFNILIDYHLFQQLYFFIKLVKFLGVILSLFNLGPQLIIIDNNLPEVLLEGATLLDFRPFR